MYNIHSQSANVPAFSEYRNLAAGKFLPDFQMLS